jgi:hypothetical protein
MVIYLCPELPPSAGAEAAALFGIRVFRPEPVVFLYAPARLEARRRRQTYRRRTSS